MSTYILGAAAAAAILTELALISALGHHTGVLLLAARCLKGHGFL